MARKADKDITYTKGGYREVTDGEWIPVNWRDNYDQCCDCGLIHKVNYRLVEGNKLQVQVFRDHRATNGARIGYKFTKDEE